MRNQSIAWTFVTAAALVSAGCQARRHVPAPAPAPAPPTVFEAGSDPDTVNITSIPVGARVFAVRQSDGGLGDEIGVTPCSMQWALGQNQAIDYSFRFGGGPFVMNLDPGYTYTTSFEQNGFVKLAFIKEGFAPKVVERKMATYAPRLEAQGARAWKVTWNAVPSTLTEVLVASASASGAAQQQQQQQQQVITLGGSSSAEATGTVTVSCDVEDAEVYLDGVFVGNCPAMLQLSAAAHVIEVKKEGFATFRRDLVVLKGSAVTVRANLRRSP